MSASDKKEAAERLGAKIRPTRLERLGRGLTLGVGLASVGFGIGLLTGMAPSKRAKRILPAVAPALVEIIESFFDDREP